MGVIYWVNRVRRGAGGPYLHMFGSCDALWRWQRWRRWWWWNHRGDLRSSCWVWVLLEPGDANS